MSQGAIAKCWLNGERKSPATLKLTGTTNSWIDPRLNQGFRVGMLWGDGILIRNILNICMYVYMYVCYVMLCMYVYIYVRVIMCIYICVCVSACHCIYIYTYVIVYIEIYMSLKVNWKSIEINWKLIEINQSILCSTPMIKKHPKVDPKIVGGADTNQDPTLYTSLSLSPSFYIHTDLCTSHQIQMESLSFVYPHYPLVN